MGSKESNIFKACQIRASALGARIWRQNSGISWDRLDQEKIDRVEAKKIAKYLRGIGLVNAAKDIETGEYER